MHRLFVLVLFVLTSRCLAADEYQPRNSQKPGEHPPSPEAALDAITVPDGFRVTLFAAEPAVRQPVAICLDDRGRLWVAESYSYKEWQERGEDRILVFEDTDGDGRHDRRTVFWSGGMHLSGFTLGRGGVWVCDSPNLLFIPDRDRDDVPDGPPEVVLDGWTTRAGHNFYNGLKWGLDGWLYGRHGITAPSRVGPPGTPDSERTDVDCSIWRWHPERAVFEVVLRGTTNPWGLDWNDLGEMFMTGNVNGHLWHAIPGARYPRMHGQGFLRHVYGRIGYCADHLHHPGSTGNWTGSRGNRGENSRMGGGHSHCGAMIYLGHDWPERYRDTVFMNNTHGRRVNNDRLERQGSGYVARHGADFLLANQPWYRGVELVYGPDGGVYLADWTDHGECHDNDGVHRTSGRIYKVTWGAPEPVEHADLQALAPRALARLHTHRNEYHVRHARRILQERDAEAAGMAAARAELDRLFADGPVRVRLRAAWTLHAMDALGPRRVRRMLDDPDEHLRAWGVRLACDHGPPAPELADRLVEMAEGDGSALVRMYLASVTPRMRRADQWRMTERLVRASAFAEDANIPLMTWYAVEPLVAADPRRALKVFLVEGRADLPLHQRYIARRIASAWGRGDAAIAGLVRYLGETKNPHALDGMHEALRGLRGLKAPPGWERLAGLDGMERFEKIFGGDRGMTVEDWAALMKIPERRLQAITELGGHDDPKIAGLLLKEFRRYNRAETAAALSVLASRPTYADTLLEAMRKGRVRREHISASHAVQIRNLGHPGLTAELEKVWGAVRKSPEEKRRRIAAWEEKLPPAVLAGADLKRGADLFARLCAACHVLHGEGGRLGPELTGSDRGNLFYLLENLVDPGAVLPDAYRLTVLELKDGRRISGTVARENGLSLTVQNVEGSTVVPADQVSGRTVLDQSVMPEGLLLGLSDADVRDLIAYLQAD